MAKAQITISVPKSLWQAFRLACHREGVSMQRWIEQAVRDELVTKPPVPAPRISATQPFLQMLTIAPGGGQAQKVASKKARLTRGAPDKQIVARLERADLAELQKTLGDRGVSVSAWLKQKMTEAAAARPLFAADLLSSAVLKRLGRHIPKDPCQRDQVARALLDWPDEVILHAAATPELYFLEVVRTADPWTISELLRVAAKQVDAAKSLAALIARRERDQK